MHHARIIVVLAAGCLSGCGSSGLSSPWATGGGAGPVLGWVPGRGASFGWEAGAFKVRKSSARPDRELGHFNLGMSWRRSTPEVTRTPLTYLAWEPVFWAGQAPIPATLGLGYWDGLRPVLGTWAGLPVPLFTRPCISECTVLSLTLGWRWSGVHELYFAPKLGFISGVAYSDT